MIASKCPVCGSGLNISDRLAGRAVACPECGEPVRAPAGSEAVPRPPPPRTQADPPEPPVVVNPAGRDGPSLGPVVRWLRASAWLGCGLWCAYALCRLASVAAGPADAADRTAAYTYEIGMIVGGYVLARAASVLLESPGRPSG